MRVKITIAQEEDGDYVVCCPVLGCFTQGDTYEEAMANIREAIECYLVRGSVHPNASLYSPTSCVHKNDE